eukprot:scaffold121747_cov21-Prasinocladus_malaysianus.AAC.1
MPSNAPLLECNRAWYQAHCSLVLHSIAQVVISYKQGELRETIIQIALFNNLLTLHPACCTSLSWMARADIQVNATLNRPRRSWRKKP